MASTDFFTIRNYKQFEQRTRQVTQAADMDPALVFQTALPGFLNDLYKDMGAWNGREERAFAWTSGQGTARAVSANERARMGGYETQQVIARPGFELAGETQSVYPSDFQYGGMNAEEVTRRALRPRLDWNRTAFTKALDVATQGGKSTGAPIQEFAYTATDFQGNTVTKSLITETATEAADVLANSTQSILWPNRTGGTFAANHDHVINNAGAAWTLALGAAHRDLILEHPGNGGTVRAYVGTAVASAIRTVLKSEYGAISERVGLIRQQIPTVGGLGAATLVAANLEGVDYWTSPDMDTNQALYVAEGRRPFYFSKGMKGVDGQGLGTGSWFENENPETRGVLYGYRDWLNLGTDEPVAAAIVDYIA